MYSCATQGFWWSSCTSKLNKWGCIYDVYFYMVGLRIFGVCIPWTKRALVLKGYLGIHPPWTSVTTNWQLPFVQGPNCNNNSLCSKIRDDTRNKLRRQVSTSNFITEEPPQVSKTNITWVILRKQLVQVNWRDKYKMAMSYLRKPPSGSAVAFRRNFGD